jgi:hypothetical protein
LNLWKINLIYKIYMEFVWNEIVIENREITSNSYASDEYESRGIESTRNFQMFQMGPILIMGSGDIGCRWPFGPKVISTGSRGKPEQAAMGDTQETNKCLVFDTNALRGFSFTDYCLPCVLKCRAWGGVYWLESARNKLNSEIFCL